MREYSFRGKNSFPGLFSWDFYQFGNIPLDSSLPIMIAKQEWGRNESERSNGPLGIRDVKRKMGGDSHGHGHGPPYIVPDYKIYKVSDAPELVIVEKALASHGLKDPWIRN
ncbi:hypothetical protein NQ317_003229 [Molorchus minor]|uniref:Uncharacterized protein n=1 Tax=Molorchus minor TaxID=1323400 RepID=A0ABQ9JDW1_9CUCU|nr:hypothetical protein NQ317_003229 [Molorchus minor]